MGDTPHPPGWECPCTPGGRDRMGDTLHAPGRGAPLHRGERRGTPRPPGRGAPCALVPSECEGCQVSRGALQLGGLRVSA